MVDENDAGERIAQEVIDFDVNDARILEVREEFKEIDAYKDLEAAKAAKKVLTKMRTTLGEKHKEAKADALAYGRKLDAYKNDLLSKIKEIEDPISDQLNEIKNAAARAEEDRVNAIEAELFKIDALAMDRHELSLDELAARQERLRAIPITEAIFQEMFETAQTHVQDIEMKLRICVGQEKERIEEERRQAEIAEANRIEQEKLAAERAAFEAEKAQAAAERAETDRIARDQEALKAAKEREELAEKQRAIDEESARLAAIRKAEEEAEYKAEADRIAALQAPDKEKLEVFADNIKLLITNKPIMQSEAGADAMLEAIALLIEVEDDLRKRTEEMK